MDLSSQGEPHHVLRSANIQFVRGSIYVKNYEGYATIGTRRRVRCLLDYWEGGVRVGCRRKQS